MAEYLIQDTTLDAIADAINTKLDTSVAMTPAQMVTAIGSISGGGGLDLIADYTAPEDVSAIQIDFTSAMQGYGCYMVVLEGQFNRNEYPCPAVNDEPGTSFYMSAVSANTNARRVFYLLNYDLSGGAWTLAKGTSGATAAKSFNAPISYIKIATYYADGRFKTGFNVKVYGGKAQ